MFFSVSRFNCCNPRQHAFQIWIIYQFVDLLLNHFFSVSSSTPFDSDSLMTRSVVTLNRLRRKHLFLNSRSKRRRMSVALVVTESKRQSWEADLDTESLGRVWSDLSSDRNEKWFPVVASFVSIWGEMFDAHTTGVGSWMSEVFIFTMKNGSFLVPFGHTVTE